MTTTTDRMQERRRVILAEMGKIENIVEGKLTEQHRERSRDGHKEIQGPYHHLQRRRDGRNDTRYIPAAKVEAVQQGIEGFERFKELADQFVRVSETAILSGRESGSKKKPMRR